MNVFRDEKGKCSMARIAFAVTLCITLGLCIADALSPTINMPDAGYSLLGTVVIALAGWAGGPRVLQYLGPQIGKVAAGISQAAAGRGERLYRDIDTEDGEGKDDS